MRWQDRHVATSVHDDRPLRSPKLQPAARQAISPGAKYYAGYDAGFVTDLLPILGVTKGSLLLDPWNGAGTTTTVAHGAGVPAIGFDINPVLVIVGKAKLLSFGVAESLRAILDGVLERARNSSLPPAEGEPLCQWFTKGTAAYLRALESGLQQNLVLANAHVDLTSSEGLDRVSALAASFYVALFETVRSFLREYGTSNPTWVKRPGNIKERISLSRDRIDSRFRVSEQRLHKHLLTIKGEPHDRPQALEGSRIAVGSSMALPLPAGSIDACISSPPYCTRIDYAVLTRPELAVLGVDDSHMRTLREATIGTTTMASAVPEPRDDWGLTTAEFLERVSSHHSKASATYYRRYFLQYFDMMHQSMQELRRCLRDDGKAALVVQDSYYKDVRLDLAKVLREMGAGLGWAHATQADFTVPRTMATMHPFSHKYRSDFRATESLLILAA
ncbi:MAG: hypothetical protein QOK05_589 [Chloroflexota bacterium]|jgi:hypothetical protein|nr:hypothetical protein [Chloroflexota bacterium]